MRTFLPRSSFELSALPEILAVEQSLTKRRQVHTACATTLLTIDHCGPAGSDRHDALKGLTQAWDYLARQHGEEVHVEYTGQPWHSFSTTVTPRETLADLDESAVDAWTERVGETLGQFDAATTLVVLAGQSYVNPLRSLLEECSAAVEYPFAATAGIGEQMSWLKAEITAAQNDPDTDGDTVAHALGDDHAT